MSKKWMEVQELVADCWEWHSPALQVTFRFVKPGKDDDFWEVWAFPAVQELVGGKDDGETVWSGFSFDVLRFLQGFEPEAVAISTRQSPSVRTDHRGKVPRDRTCFSTCASNRPKMPKRPRSLTSAEKAGRLCGTRSELMAGW